MELIRQGFAAGTGRNTALLKEALSGDKNIYKFFITDELTSDDIMDRVERNQLPFEDYPKFRIIYNAHDVISIIRGIIFSLEGIPSNEPVEIYVSNSRPINFDEFKEVEGLTIYHYIQTNREVIENMMKENIFVKLSTDSCERKTVIISTQTDMYQIYTDYQEDIVPLINNQLDKERSERFYNNASGISFTEGNSVKRMRPSGIKVLMHSLNKSIDRVLVIPRQ